MPETVKTLVQVPAAPTYGVPVVSRQLRLRFKGNDLVRPYTRNVELGASTEEFDLPAGKHCFIELVNVLDAEGTIEQGLLDFPVGEARAIPGGFSTTPAAQPAEAAPADDTP